MTIGHIYVIDIKKTDPSYITALTEFCNLFSPGHDWAVEAKRDLTVEFAIRNGGLDSKIHAYFLLKTQAQEIRINDHKSLLSFPSFPFGMDREKISPGDEARAEGKDATEVKVAEIEEVKKKIDEAHGR